MLPIRDHDRHHARFMRWLRHSGSHGQWFLPDSDFHPVLVGYRPGYWIVLPSGVAALLCQEE